ncbi:MAG: alpha/beta hydrolase [Eubacteriales bacterium]
MKTKTIRRLTVLTAFAAAAMQLACAAPAPAEAQPPQANDTPAEAAQTITADPAEAAQLDEPAPEPQKEEETMEQGKTTVTFPSADGLTVTADLYWTGDADAPFILLFHQARYSRGEYLEIASKLNALGYNCLAVDQRSGNAVNGVANETARAAKENNLPAAYEDAYPDLEAALQYVTDEFVPKQLIAWGSSYSSSLTLILAAEHPQQIQAALAFSPGEYFRYQNQTIADYAADITQPVFITSAKKEESEWRPIAEKITSNGCVFFVPEGSGVHGSSTLFESTPNNAEYWAAVEGFLASLAP